MKKPNLKPYVARIAFAAAIVPAAFVGVVAFHPGVAHAETTLASQAHDLQKKGSYTTDLAHTSIGFEIDHLGVARIQGRFNKSAGKIDFDPQNIPSSSVTFTIETASIDTAVGARDDHLRTDDFFDAEKYPNITFKSTRIRKTDDGYVAEGDLTIKETTKRIQIPFTLHGPITDGWGQTRIGVVAEPIKINRHEYGVDYDDRLPNGVPSVGNDVTIRLSLEATLDKDSNN